MTLLQLSENEHKSIFNKNYFKISSDNYKHLPVKPMNENIKQIFIEENAKKNNQCSLTYLNNFSFVFLFSQLVASSS